MKATVILNPAAKGGTSKRIWSSVKQEFFRLRTEIELEIKETEYVGHGIKLAEEATTNSDIIVAFGGDGTTNECINGILRSQSTVPLHIVPAGTGNDIPTTLKLPLKTVDAIHVLNDFKVIYVDTGFLEEKKRYFAGVASIGFDAEVTHVANESSKRLKGTANYLLAIIKTLKKFKAKKVTIKILDSQKKVISEFTEKILLIAIGNGQYYGGGMRVVPKAHVVDGKFHVVLAKEASIFELFKILPWIYSGRHIYHPVVKEFDAFAIKVIPEEDDDLLVQIDGEVVGELPEMFITRPKSLPIVYPRKR